MPVALALATLPLGVCADEPPAGREPRQRPLWELGLAGIGLSQLAYPGSDTRVARALAVPYALYRGRVFRADERNVGVRALRSERVEFDVGVAAAFGSSANEVKIREGMPRLGTLAEIGPQLLVRLGPLEAGRPAARHPLTLELPLRGVFDVSDKFAYRGLSFEPRLTWRTALPARFALSLNTSLLFGSGRLADTFYGVDAQYARADRPAYSASAGLISTRFGATLSRPIGQDVRLFGFLRVDHVGGAANADSPLVRQRTGWTAGLGFNWTFLKSSEPGAP
ncbi:MAG: MipA/OmpV family protein [Lautropia sp.]